MATDSDRLRAMAARLMGKGPVAAPRPTPPSPSTPCSMPWPQIASNSENVPIRAQAPPPAEIEISSSKPASDAQPAAAATTTKANPAQTPAFPPAITERIPNLNMAETNMGPSLKGDPDAIREAREFLQSASYGKIRPTRSRGTSDRGSTSSAHSSPRVPRAQEMLASSTRALPTFTTPAPAPRSTARTETVPRSQPAAPTASAIQGWGAYAKLHDRPAVTTNITPAPPFTQPQPPISAVAPTPAPTPAAVIEPKADPINRITKSFEKTPIIDTDPTAVKPVKEEDKGAGLFGRQMADVKSTLTERKSDLPPPHLRAKMAANKATPNEVVVSATKPSDHLDNKPTITSPPPTTASKPPVAASVAKPKPAAAPSFTFTPAKSIEDLKPTLHPTAPSFSPKRYSEEELKALAPASATAKGTKTNPIVINGEKKEEQTMKVKEMTRKAGGESEDVVVMLAALKKEVTALTTKVKHLETENAEMAHQMEQLIKVDERRRFLGTDAAKAPFSLEVTYPNNNTLAIQVSAETKISDLIRRARNDAKLTSSDTKNPRISIGGEQVGHGMTLGELGVMRGEAKKVVFYYDGAEDEVL